MKSIDTHVSEIYIQSKYNLFNLKTYDHCKIIEYTALNYSAINLAKKLISSFIYDANSHYMRYFGFNEDKKKLR